MNKNHYFNDDKNKEVNNSFLNYLVSFSSLIASLISIAVWGGNISARVKRIEKDVEGWDERQIRIEAKLDRMNENHNRSLHEFKDEILKAIFSHKSG